MGYYEAMRRKGSRMEMADIQKKARKKGLWGSVGRTLGGLGAMALTGGTAAPWVAASMAAGGSLFGGAIGTGLSDTGDLGKGRQFHGREAQGLQKELSAFGSKNITSALQSGLTAGIGQKLKLGKLGTEAHELGKTAEEVEKIRKGVGFGESLRESAGGKFVSKVKGSLAEAKATRVAPTTGNGETLQAKLDRLHTESGLQHGDISESGMEYRVGTRDDGTKIYGWHANNPNIKKDVVSNVGNLDPVSYDYDPVSYDYTQLRRQWNPNLRPSLIDPNASPFSLNNRQLPQSGMSSVISPSPYFKGRR